MTTAKEMKRMDEETRKKAQAIFERLGLTEEQAVEMPFAAAEGETKKIKKKRMNERFAEWDAF